MNTKYIISFFGINIILSFFLIFQNKITDLVTPTVAFTEAPVIKPKPKPVPKPVLATTETTMFSIKNVCFGGLTSTEKDSLFPILTTLPPLSYTVTQKTPQEIYWNLGSNETIARALFEKQKTNGIMSDPKYQLTFSDNTWIVSVQSMFITEAEALAVATDLAQKAQKVNAGGRWQYRSQPVVYSVNFNDNITLNKEHFDFVNITLSSKIVPCVPQPMN